MLHERVCISFVEYLSICQTVNGWGWGKFVEFGSVVYGIDSSERVF